MFYTLGYILAGIVCLILMTRKEFWLLTVVVGELASLFAILACIIHFQILGALAFVGLLLILDQIVNILTS